MTYRVIRRFQARRDLIDQALHIAEENPDAAERFLDAVEDGIRVLRSYPRIGVARDFANPELVGMRSWPVPGLGRGVLGAELPSSLRRQHEGSGPGELARLALLGEYDRRRARDVALADVADHDRSRAGVFHIGRDGFGVEGVERGDLATNPLHVIGFRFELPLHARIEPDGLGSDLALATLGDGRGQEIRVVTRPS